MEEFVSLYLVRLAGEQDLALNWLQQGQNNLLELLLRIHRLLQIDELENRDSHH